MISELEPEKAKHIFFFFRNSLVDIHISDTIIHISENTVKNFIHFPTKCDKSELSDMKNKVAMAILKINISSEVTAKRANTILVSDNFGFSIFFYHFFISKYYKP